MVDPDSTTSVPSQSKQDNDHESEEEANSINDNPDHALEDSSSGGTQSFDGKHPEKVMDNEQLSLESGSTVGSDYSDRSFMEDRRTSLIPQIARGYHPEIVSKIIEPPSTPISAQTHRKSFATAYRLRREPRRDLATTNTQTDWGWVVDTLESGEGNIKEGRRAGSKGKGGAGGAGWAAGTGGSGWAGIGGNHEHGGRRAGGSSRAGGAYRGGSSMGGGGGGGGGGGRGKGGGAEHEGRRGPHGQGALRGGFGTDGEKGGKGGINADHTVPKIGSDSGGHHIPGYAGILRGTMKLGDTGPKQMNIINYLLSSQRCIDEGWTQLPAYVLLDQAEARGDMDIFIQEPIFTHGITTSLIQKYYPSGNKFLTIFPDGSGNVFYPSGNLAIMISFVELGQHIYVVHDDTPFSDIMALFRSNGHGTCYHRRGTIRLFFDKLGGVELDVYGGRKRKWSWMDPIKHVHPSPLQPIHMGLNGFIGIRVLSQDNIALTFVARTRSCRFNVGSRLKLIAPENIPKKEVSKEYLFLEESKLQVRRLLDRVANLLKFPKSPRVTRILPPLSLTNKMHTIERLRQMKEDVHQSSLA